MPKLLVPTCSCLIHEPEAVETCDLSSIQHWSPLSIRVVGGNLFTITPQWVISLTWRRVWIINVLASSYGVKNMLQDEYKRKEHLGSTFSTFWLPTIPKKCHQATTVNTFVCLAFKMRSLCSSHTFLDTFLLTDTTQSATGFFSALSAVSFSLVNSIAVTCSMLNTFSSSMYITFKEQSRQFINVQDFKINVDKWYRICEFGGFF